MNDEINLTSTATKLTFPATSAGLPPWNIHVRTWGRIEESSAVALLVHGLGAHSGWFEAFARRLNDKGIFVMSYDQIGFGARRNEKFHSKDQWLADLVASFNHLKERADGKPIYLIGNSMGAVVAYSRAAQLKPDAMVLFSPGFDGHPKTFSLPYKLRALVTGLLAPDSELTLPYTVDDITPTQSVRDFLTADPDRRFTIAARMGIELLKLTESIKKQSKAIPCPVFMATAGLEKIVDNTASQRVFDGIQAPSKTQITLKDSWHDLMFEPELDKLVTTVTDWLRSVKPMPV
ncbi:MAG: alpha/beta fold hydrolase [Candidatus Melainabacteria bacterium]|nr:alpha/beta fold hydrolase [Candidatus Melainabacteria bacterium]